LRLKIENNFAEPSDESPARLTSAMVAGGDGSFQTKPEGFRVVKKVVDFSR